MTERLRPYFCWYVSALSVNREEIETGLVKVLERTGLKKGFWKNTRFSNDGVAVNIEYEAGGAKTYLRVGLESNSVEKGEKYKIIIQRQIDEFAKKLGANVRPENTNYS